MSLSGKRRIGIVVVLSLGLWAGMVASGSAQAPAPVMYTTAKDGNWSDPSVFSPQGIPSSLDTVTFQHKVTVQPKETQEIACLIDSGGQIIVDGGTLWLRNGAGTLLGRNLAES